jgi:adhesin transport system membrane fusion protein
LICGALSGKIADISPDALQDERGQPYLRVRLEAAAKDFLDLRSRLFRECWRM